jgi:hypothetical protein
MLFQKGISIKNRAKNFFFGILKVTVEKSRDPDQHLDPHPRQNVTDPEHCQEALKTRKLSNTIKKSVAVS